MTQFSSLKIDESLVELLATRKITDATNVQAEVIPKLLEQKNLIFESETGTGKTFAFLLPIVHNLLQEKKSLLQNNLQVPVQPRAIIVAPTHELASQIRQEAEWLCSADDDNTKQKLKSALLVGGASITRQIDVLKTKPQIIVGGASRLLELIRLKKLKTTNLNYLVLDEVDRLFSKELRDITTELLEALPKDLLIVACSATVKDNLTKILQDATCKEFELCRLAKEDVLKMRISHFAIFAERRDKIDTLRKVINSQKIERALVFCAETGQIENITSKLQYKKIICTALHAKSDKIDRKKALDTFRSGKCPILVTSDLASRGLDIQNVSHIIQMDVPSNEDFFVHRAGRTGRAGKNGTNIVIGDAHEMRRLSQLEKKLGIIVYPKMLYKGKLIAPDEID